MWYNVNITVDEDFQIEADNMEEAMEEAERLIYECMPDIEITEE